MTKLMHYVMAVTFIIAAFITTYAINLAVMHDPQLRGVELFVMACTFMSCLVCAMMNIMFIIVDNPKDSDNDDG